jgi:type IV secretory pathway VirB10-like protein
MDLKITPKHLILALAGWAFALSAAAQYQWVGKDGRKVFSDRPPPADIQEKDILKQPGSRRAALPVIPAETTEAAGTTAAAAPAAVAKPKIDPNAPKISGKDAELEAKKKKLEEEAVAKKKAEDEKITQAQAENCERAKKAVATFQSGVRVASTNAKGEREIMDDSVRASELKRVQAVVDRDCNKLPAQ